MVEDNAAEQQSVAELLGHDDIDIVTADSGAEALEQLREEPFDCVVLDLRLPDMSGFEVLEKIRDDAALRDLPVVVFTGRELSRRGGCDGCIPWPAASWSRASSRPSACSTRPRCSCTGWSPICRRRSSTCSSGCTARMRICAAQVLLVDDDARNIFALSSVLERHGMEVLTATTGSEAIAVLNSRAEVAIVLMDIMMPGMDGYETMQAIRENPSSGALPILALTAKAMKGDREKCLEAGASDYLAKPVNIEQLLSALRMWLHR